MPTVDAGGIIHNVTVSGPEGAPAVLLIHALGVDHQVWQPQTEALASEYRVIAYDLRGHGRSAAPASDYNMALLAEDARNLLDQLAVERAAVIGLSIGGMIAQSLALRHPERIDKLGLISTARAMPPASEWDERIATVSAEGTAALIEPTLEVCFSPTFRQSGNAWVERIAEMLRACPDAGYIGCCRAIQGFNAGDDLKRVMAPALVLHGEHDPEISEAMAVDLERALPRATRMSFPAAHMLQIEQADRCAQTLHSFLRV